MFHEIPLSHAPVYKQVFGEERRDDHAAAVMHPADGIELAHGGVDDRVASFAFAPGAEVGGVVGPFDIGVFGFERFVHAGCVNIYATMKGPKGSLPDIRPVSNDVLVEVAPCYFADPSLDALDAIVEFLTGITFSSCADGSSGAQCTCC